MLVRRKAVRDCSPRHFLFSPAVRCLPEKNQNQFSFFVFLSIFLFDLKYTEDAEPIGSEQEVLPFTAVYYNAVLRL